MSEVGVEDPSVESFKESGDDALASWCSDRRIKSIEDALAFGKVDTSVWYVDRWECVSWEVGMRLRSQGKPDKPVKKQLWRVKLYLKRILPKPHLEALKALYERVREAAPSYPKLARPRITRASHMLEVDLYDVHFGKLAWAPESGQNYDLAIAERIYRNAVEDLVARASGYRVDKIVLTIGSDFFHVDGPKNTTTKGTQVAADGRYAKIIATGNMAVIRAVEYLAAKAPVEVVWIKGNHDHISSFHLAQFVWAYFHRSNRVKVDLSPMSRKYVRFGTNLIGYDHGDEIPDRDLPAMMATERPEDWSATSCHEWRVGHVHKAKEMQSVCVDTHHGCVVRTLRSLSATDSWHYEHGFVGGVRAADGFLMSYTDGFVAAIGANVRE